MKGAHQQQRQRNSNVAPISNCQLLVESDVNTATNTTTSSQQQQHAPHRGSLAAKGKLVKASFPTAATTAGNSKFEGMLNVAPISNSSQSKPEEQQQQQQKESPRAGAKKQPLSRPHIRSQPSAFECQHTSVTLCAHSSATVYYKRVACTQCRKPLVATEQREGPLFSEPPGGAGKNSQKPRRGAGGVAMYAGRGGGGGGMMASKYNDGEYEKIHDEVWYRRVRGCSHPQEEQKVGQREEEASAWCGRCGALRHPERRTFTNLDGADDEER